MVWLQVILIVSILWTSGCTSNRGIQKNKTMTMMDIYANGIGQSKKDMAKFIEQKLKEQKTFGYVKPYIPVVNEPVVRKVWIPDHKSEDNVDVMIAGHWVYVMIQPATWFIENKNLERKFPILIPNSPTQESRKKYGDHDSEIREDI